MHTQQRSRVGGGGGGLVKAPLLLHGQTAPPPKTAPCFRPPQRQKQGAGQQLDCRQKLVMALSVDGGDAVATASVELSLPCVGSPTGACPCPCDYATDLSCQCRDLVSPLRLNITKSPVWANYPIQYLQAVNWRPTEGVVRPGDARCKVRQCARTCAFCFLLELGESGCAKHTH